MPLVSYINIHEVDALLLLNLYIKSPDKDKVKNEELKVLIKLLKSKPIVALPCFDSRPMALNHFS